MKRGELTIVPQEARIVRFIVQSYLCGMGKLAICKMLNEQHIPTKNGGMWQPSTITGILRNEKYAGDLLLQKRFRLDHIEKKDVKNRGELPMYFVPDNHEAIISRETEQRLKMETLRRCEQTPQSCKYTKREYAFTGVVICGQCGKHFNRRHNNGKIAWQCSTYLKWGKAHCSAKQIHETILMDLATQVLGDTEFNEQSLHRQIKEIHILPGNHVQFFFFNGTMRDVVWKDPPRRDSWTPEMKLRAAERSKRGRN